MPCETLVHLREKPAEFAGVLTRQRNARQHSLRGVDVQPASVNLTLGDGETFAEKGGKADVLVIDANCDPFARHGEVERKPKRRAECIVTHEIRYQHLAPRPFEARVNAYPFLAATDEKVQLEVVAAMSK
jgi:hypothetical protein